MRHRFSSFTCCRRFRARRHSRGSERSLALVAVLAAFALAGSTQSCGKSDAKSNEASGGGASGMDNGDGSNGDTDGAVSPSGGASGDLGDEAGAGSAVGGAGDDRNDDADAAIGTGGNGAADTGAAGVPAAPWDWVGVLGTGQSLAVGDHGTPVATTTQPYHNLKLATGALAWPVDPNNAALQMVPLVEPIGRLAPTYPSSWPTNIAGETAHASMGNQITALVLGRGGVGYVNVHGEFGENGQCLTFLRKGAVPTGVNGRAFAATLIETQAVTRLAAAAGKTYGIGAIIVTHGECDAGNANYNTDLYRLWSDYNADLPAITGQTQKIQMIVSQQNAVSDRSASTLAQWRIGVDHPDDVVCSGPKYQYRYAADGIHLVTDGYRQLGEKYGQVYFERVVLGRSWQPLQPTMVERSGRVITVSFHVPVPPLAWETTFQAPHQNIPEWATGKGFEVRAANARVGISSVTISGNAVQITCGSDLPATGLTVGYALTADAAVMSTPFAGTLRWGQLRDSDPFVGTMTQKPQPNYAVAFELPVP